MNIEQSDIPLLNLTLLLITLYTAALTLYSHQRSNLFHKSSIDLLGGDNLTVLPPGLPNITGIFYTGNWQEATGAFISDILTLGKGGHSDASAYVQQVMLNANLSNTIYGNSTTVQPPSFTFIPQIKF